MIKAIKILAQLQQDLAKRAYCEYLPLADNIISTKSKSKDINHISLILDCILDFCFDSQMLLLYRKLCRYLYNIDQVAALSYVNAYREMWDEEGNEFRENFKEEAI